MVEFTLVVPVFLLLLLGIAQLGIAFNNYIELTDSVRVGARKAAVSRTDPNRVNVTKNAVQNSAANLNKNCGSGGLCVDDPVTNWAPGSTVKVCAHYPYSISLLWFVTKSGTLNSCTTERVE